MLTRLEVVGLMLSKL
jgi:glycine/D-amino acid oxidase-like deaminating enzyme